MFQPRYCPYGFAPVTLLFRVSAGVAWRETAALVAFPRLPALRRVRPTASFCTRLWVYPAVRAPTYAYHRTAVPARASFPLRSPYLPLFGSNTTRLRTFIPPVPLRIACGLLPLRYHCPAPKRLDADARDTTDRQLVLRKENAASAADFLFCPHSAHGSFALHRCYVCS